MKNIQYSINTLRSTRLFVLDLMGKFSYEQLTTVPAGFSNSMLWNFGHIVVVQQLLIYGLSGNELHLDKNIVHLFKKGATGKETLSKKEFEDLKIRSLELVDLLEKDYERICQTDYTQFMTGLNVELNNVDEAIEFNNIHEAVHIGVMMGISKLV
ncbi:MAG TPA: DinB family protein [Crocinitomicaceae bacterium]|nr:DinB family protein [Crocinitomicaceae bacterium]